MTKPRLLSCAALGVSVCLGLSLPPGQAQACEVLPLLEPAPGAWVGPQQALLRWQPHPQGRYRLQLRVSRPEGPTLQSMDLALNDPQWRLTQPPGTDKASVQVRVTVGCNDDGVDELVAQAPAFFIRQPVACRVDATTLRQQGARLSWASVAGARAYRVRVAQAPRIGLPAIDDSPAWLPPQLQAMHQAQVIEPQATLPSVSRPAMAPSETTPPAPLVAIVQAQCGSQAGPPATLVLSPAQP